MSYWSIFCYVCGMILFMFVTVLPGIGIDCICFMLWQTCVYCIQERADLPVL